MRDLQQALRIESPTYVPRHPHPAMNSSKNSSQSDQKNDNEAALTSPYCHKHQWISQNSEKRQERIGPFASLGNNTIPTTKRMGACTTTILAPLQKGLRERWRKSMFPEPSIKYNVYPIKTFKAGLCRVSPRTKRPTTRTSGLRRKNDTHRKHDSESALAREHVTPAS